MPISNNKQIKSLTVTSCSDDSYWYADRVGESFKVLRIEKLDGYVMYWVRTGGFLNTLNFVLDSDCKVYPD
jgi:hypothetical protein